MGNILTGLFAITVFLLFVGGLAESIGALPFILIVVFVSVLAVVALWEEIRGDILRWRGKS
ncbi:hypothetical protein KAJ83_00645 [Marivibrio halodurans]|uniref:Uncharacterized protein n=1 Tax=Marivibrio halodurans TaxID=2039722 RepID=A0A8J7SKH1_9PROT|nr:hypothetical protein [Marivibrio halodurans]MBP5855501.1 hypothetical protein [Marivibrio halodurans]